MMSSDDAPVSTHLITAGSAKQWAHAAEAGGTDGKAYLDVPGEHEGPPGMPRSSVPLKILVVDDNVDSAMTMGIFLDLSGHVTRLAYDGPEAVTAAADFRPDVVLMDIGLPGLSGLDAARAIRREPWAAGTVLIALSGWGQEADRQRSREAGFQHHLVKPVDHEVLSKILEGVTARS
jgi:CheY-like chemotaxis protein